MIAVNEGNSECLRCEHFDLGLGCALIAVKNKLPPCGRDVVLTQEEYKRFETLKTKKKVIIKTIDSDLHIGRMTFRAGTHTYWCPNCNKPVTGSDIYCRHCGQAIGWEEI